METIAGKEEAQQGGRGLVAAAWGFVVYLIGVILFGAWVRITGSGAGCGDHWPDCNGQIVPRAPSTETMIEFGHRLTSGLCGVFAVALVVWTWRRLGARHRATVAAGVALFFVLVEGAIGARLVLDGLVTDDSSVARAVVISLHLVNTLALVGAAALSAWWAQGRPLPRWPGPGRRTWAWLLLVGLVGLVATSMTGAITALGDTLFPVDPTVSGGLVERLRADISGANHFLVRLRIVHPVVAISVAFYLLAVAEGINDKLAHVSARRWALALQLTVLANCVLGGLNVALHAPGWLQVVHLAVAQTVWIAALLTTCAALLPGAMKPGTGARG